MKINRQPEIIRASFELFQEKGYEQVSVMDICAACGITKPTFYKYARSKGDILKSACHLTNEMAETDALQLPASPQTIKVRDRRSLLNPHYETELARQKANEAIKGKSCVEKIWVLAALGFSTGLRLGPELYAHYLHHILTEPGDAFALYEPIHEALVECLVEGQRSGEVGNLSDVEDLYMAIAHLNIGNSLRWIAYPDFPVEKQLREDLLAILDVPQEVIAGSNLASQLLLPENSEEYQACLAKETE